MNHNLFSQIISVDNLISAFGEFKKGKRHKAEVALFELYSEEKIFCLHQVLKNGLYQHGPYFKFKISDPKPRIIHKATVQDRVIHQAIYRILYPIFNRSFFNDSYSSRIEKGTHRAIKRLEFFARSISRHYHFSCFSLKLDIRKFFDSIDHQILKELIKKKISCQKTLKLISQVIDSFCSRPDKGLPLGNVTSQLFANIYLHELDFFVKHVLKERYYLRFCDDFIILKEENNFNFTYKAIKHFLAQKLLLELKSDKLKVRKLKWGLDYLGFVALPHHLILRPKTRKRMLRKLKEKYLDLKSGKISRGKFNQTLQSYLGLTKHADGYLLAEMIKAKYQENYGK